MKEARSVLQRSVAATVERFWPADGARPIAIDPEASPVDALYDKVEELSPQSDVQRSLRSQALTTALDVRRMRLLLFEHLGSSIPAPFLVVLVFWLCIIFASFGLFAPRNATVITVLGVCALSVSGAIFLILELDRSFEGLLQVSGAPLRAAVAQLGR
jgi:membrane-bound ClpP family serine protease